MLDSFDLPSVIDSESDHESATNEQPDKQEASLKDNDGDVQLIK